MRRNLLAALSALVVSGCLGAVSRQGPDDRPGPDAAVPSDDGAAPRDLGPGVDAALPDRGVVPTSDGGRPPDTVPLVVGIGTGFLTLVSCDDGLTYSEHRALPGADCIADGDCSHDPGRGLGLAYSNGWFVAVFGNQEGEGTGIRRSRDGVTWTEVFPDSPGGGLAVGRGRIVAAARPAIYSDDDGATWERGPMFETRAGADNPRQAFYIPHGGGRWLLVFDTGGTVDVVISDDGRTFRSIGAFPDGCGVSDFAYGDGVAVIVSRQGNVCRSIDGGETWSAGPLMAGGSGTDQLNGVLWNGREFIAYHYFDGFRSPDGVTWTRVTLSPDFSEVRRPKPTTEGTWLTNHGGNSPGVRRSTDGLRWESVGGYSDLFIDQFIGGYGLSTACD